MASDYLESIALQMTPSLQKILVEDNWVLVAELRHTDSGDNSLDRERYQILQDKGLLKKAQVILGDELAARIGKHVPRHLQVYHDNRDGITIFEIYRKLEVKNGE